MTRDGWGEGTLDLALDAIPGFAYEADGEGAAVVSSPGACALLGSSGARAGWWRDLVHPDDLDLVWPLVRATLNGEKPGHAVEYRLRDPSGRWRLVADRARGEWSNARHRTAGLVVDVTEERATAERLRHLAGELDHRVKNALANIMSLVTLTSAGDADRSRTPARTLEALMGRIDAFARVQTMLSAGRWLGADLRSLAEAEVRASSGGGTVRLQGPAAGLQGGAAQSLAMAIHELATNARAFGAWSVDGGAVEVSWAVEDDGFALTWTERGGPPVTPPATEGLGLQILRDMPAMEMRADVTLTFDPAGLRFALRCPVERALSDAPIPGAGTPVSPARDPGAPRVLVVEDVWSTAMIAVRAIRSRGWHVIGPVQSVEAAMDAVLERPDVVVLDLNLHNAFAVNVVERLRRLKIPFLVTTGYPDAMDALPAARSAPRLVKPYDEAALMDALETLVSRPD